MRRATHGTSRGLLLFLAMTCSALVGGAARAPTVGLARAGPAVGARARSSRREAVALAIESLARDRGVEGPRAIVAGLPGGAASLPFSAIGAEPCSRGPVAARVDCHLRRPSAEITAAPTRRGWRVTVFLPELSDHVHRVTISSGPRGAAIVEVDSRN